jgi:hypothetical protein
MRFAYADPPYLGMGAKFYAAHHEDAAAADTIEWHVKLIGELVSEFPDGWALSCSSPSLRFLLPVTPGDTRIAAWVKPFHAFKKGVRPAYAWEPVLFRGGRNQKPPAPPKGGKAITPRDWVSANMTLRKGLPGAKPPEFCRWILDLLGYVDGDELVDLFPGTGVMDVVSGVTPIQSGLFESVGSVVEGEPS